MKNPKLKILAALLFFCGAGAFAADKANVTFGCTPVQKNSETDSGREFGGAYTLFDGELSAEKITVGAKVYYRVNSTSKADETERKLELKKAFVKVRPFGNEIFEGAIGKLYSYYLPGGFFSLSESYTGVSRWGKTGAGVKSEFYGLTFGAATGASESYEVYSKEWDVSGGISYDFAKIFGIPVEPGFSCLYEFEKDTKTEEKNHDFSWTASLNTRPKFSGIFNGFSFFAAFTHNSTPYAGNTTFKFLSNYKDIGRSDFASVNLKFSFWRVQLIFEGEGGKSKDSDLYPYYAGSQLLIPLAPKYLFFKPRFFYYAAIDREDGENSRKAWEFYPRLWFQSKKTTISAGFKYGKKEVSKNEWESDWSIPVYVEFKL